MDPWSVPFLGLQSFSISVVNSHLGTPLVKDEDQQGSHLFGTVITVYSTWLLLACHMLLFFFPFLNRTGSKLKDECILCLVVATGISVNITAMTQIFAHSIHHALTDENSALSATIRTDWKKRRPGSKKPLVTCALAWAPSCLVHGLLGAK